MHATRSRANSLGVALTNLLGSVSLLTMAQLSAVHAQPAAAEEDIPETVLITGSLIRGTAAVGVPVINLAPQDFAQTGAITTADLFRSIPSINVQPGPVATESGQRLNRPTNVDIHGLGVTRELLMVDGMRYPPGEKVGCAIDPSIIPQLAIDRIDVLVDGASAQYGSDAVSGVINVILKRAFDGAITQLQYARGGGGMNNYRVSQLWGRTWDGGNITLSYEWYDDSPIYRPASNWTLDFTPWGLDNRIPLASSGPATLSTGNPQTANAALSATLGRNCVNCYAIPSGTGVSFVSGNPAAPTLMWNGTTFVAINGAASGTAAARGVPGGTSNAFDPYDIAQFSPALQRNAATMTVDQRLTSNITFYGEGFYSNRRSQWVSPSNISPSGTNDLNNMPVPTFNPYYPTGAGVPQNLIINYNMGIEQPSITSGFQISSRYQGGLRIALPANWLGRIYYSHSIDHNAHQVDGTVNRNAVSAALGWTVRATAAVGTTPDIGTWTKPAAIPYLNLFCDPTAVACNSQDTLSYIQGVRRLDSTYAISEKGAIFDGPLFDLPAGEVRAAVGGTYTTFKLANLAMDNTGAPTLIVPVQTNTTSRAVWAVFAQLNIPIFSDTNARPFLRRVELEASWRHDQYSDFGGTSNPKIALNWQMHDWVTVRGSWGTNFVAPSFNQLDPLGNAAINAYNTPLFGPTSTTVIAISCTAPTGSVAAKLVAGGAPCGPSVTLPGVGQTGSAGTSIQAGLRTLVNTDQAVLQPEIATNWSVGFEFAPTTTFLSGLDIQATWYSIKINGSLGNVTGSPTTNTFSDPNVGFAFTVPSDLAPALLAQGNVADANACAAADTAPWTCPQFVALVGSLVSHPRSSVPLGLIPAPGNPNSAYWVNDGGVMNSGWLKLSGIDFNASYDWDLGGDLGAANVGISGTYYLHRNVQTVPGGAITDGFHTDINLGSVIEARGVETGPRMRYRARAGWSNGTWSVTGFMDYTAHFFHTQTAPLNVNGNFCLADGVTPGGTSPCLIIDYSNIVPSYYTFDFTVGYDTGDRPANEYLRNIGVQLVINNILDKHPPFTYGTSTGGRSPAAFDITKPNLGRVVSVIVTKTW